MEARYFRVRYNNNENGIYHTLAYRDEIKEANVHLSYLAEGGQEVYTAHYGIDILVAADLEEETLRQAETLMNSHQVKELYLPEEKADNPSLERLVKKADQVRFIKEGEDHTWKTGLWEFWVGNLGGSLSLYHGFAGTKELGEDCALSGKISDSHNPCVPSLVKETDFCGFGCLRHRDFQVIKGHLRPDRKDFRTGSLLLGKGVFCGHVSELMERLRAYKDRIRVVQLPAQMENWEDKLLELIPEEELQYYVGHSKNGRETAGAIASHSVYCRYVPAAKEEGLCLSGYFIPYLNKNHC